MRTRSSHRWILPLLVFVLVIAALAYLGYRYRGHVLSAFGYVTDATGSKTNAALTVALALAILICLFFWFIFPIVVYLGLRDLRRRTAELDETIQLALRQPIPEDRRRG